jgi:hypothetical protein
MCQGANRTGMADTRVIGMNVNRSQESGEDNQTYAA